MKNKNLMVLASLLAVYVFWGGTYLAMKFAIETMPPFLMAGSRFTIAGLFLFFIELSRGNEWPKAVHWKNAAIIGGLLLLGANGGVLWAERIIPSGVAAIIVATVPLWMVVLPWLFRGAELPGKQVSAGLLLGFSGIVFLVKNTLTASDVTPGQWVGYLVLVLAAISWAAGSLYSREADLPKSPIMSVSLQMLTGGIFFFIVGLITAEGSNLDLTQISDRSMAAFVYLIICGSLVGYTAYIWLLKNADPTVVSTHAYINPIVAVLAGWMLAGEKLAGNDILATVVIVASVVVVTTFNFRNKSSNTDKVNDKLYSPDNKRMKKG